MEKIRQLLKRFKLEYYQGSLDFPCDFCEKHSYQNYHITQDNLLTVVCEECLRQAKISNITGCDE